MSTDTRPHHVRIKEQYERKLDEIEEAFNKATCLKEKASLMKIYRYAIPVELNGFSGTEYTKIVDVLKNRQEKKMEEMLMALIFNQ